MCKSCSHFAIASTHKLWRMELTLLNSCLKSLKIATFFNINIRWRIMQLCRPRQAPKMPPQNCLNERIFFLKLRFARIFRKCSRFLHKFDYFCKNSRFSVPDDENSRTQPQRIADKWTLFQKSLEIGKIWIFMYTILLRKQANWHVARKYARMGIWVSSRPFLSALAICKYDFRHYFIDIFSPKLKQFYHVPPEASASLASCFIRYLQYILKRWSSPCIKNYTTDTYYTYRETLSFNEITLNVCFSIYTERVAREYRHCVTCMYKHIYNCSIVMHSHQNYCRDDAQKFLEIQLITNLPITHIDIYLNQCNR